MWFPGKTLKPWWAFVSMVVGVFLRGLHEIVWKGRCGLGCGIEGEKED